MGAFNQTACNLRKLQVMCPKRLFYISSQTDHAYNEKQSVGKGFGIQGKV